MRRKVEDFLRDNKEPATPTEIGMSLGKTKYLASSAVTRSLKILTKLGLVNRTKIGRKVYYSWYNAIKKTKED